MACAFFNLVIQIRKKKDYLTKWDAGQNLQSSVIKFYSEIIIYNLKQEKNLKK